MKSVHKAHKAHKASKVNKESRVSLVSTTVQYSQPIIIILSGSTRRGKLVLLVMFFPCVEFLLMKPAMST